MSKTFNVIHMLIDIALLAVLSVTLFNFIK